MDVYTFLKSLPAVLGIAGFFAYLWFGQTRIGGEILKSIVEKLRSDLHLDIKQYGQLTPAKISYLVRSDERIRNAVNEGDRKLLRLLIIFQYLLTSLVLIVCALLMGVSVWLYSRSEPLSLVQTGPEPTVKEASGLLVDLDPINVEWTCKGKEENVSVFLENVDSHRHTKKKTVASSVRSVTFDVEDVQEVTSNRKFHGKNRVRSVIEWTSGTSVSNPQELLVGILIELRVNGQLTSPNDPTRVIHTLLATIDHSTEALPGDYSFRGDFVGVTTNGPIVVPLISSNSVGEVVLPFLERIQWSKPLGFVYGGPDDPRIVRTHVFH